MLNVKIQCLHVKNSCDCDDHIFTEKIFEAKFDSYKELVDTLCRYQKSIPCLVFSILEVRK